MQDEIKKATKNTSMMYLMNIAKMVFPLITLPYLTRVLSVDGYAIVAYVKAVMQYAQIALIFGFVLSATKDIVNARENKKLIGEITGGVLEAKGVLSIIVGIIIIVMALFIPILRENPLYTLLAFINIVITEMLADFLFRGLDKMEVITIRFVVSKMLSTALTFVFIKSDADLLLVPIFDILGSLLALFWVLKEIKKLGIQIIPVKISRAIQMLKKSAIYFASDMATTSFGALNTVLVGIFMSRADVSYWSICLQLVGAVQSLYTPITNGIYPTMIRTKSFGFIKKITLLVMPVIIAGCVFCYFAAQYILLIIAGHQYIEATVVFQALIPVLLFSFPAMLYGWPALGAINKENQTSLTTIVTAVIQVIGLFVLIALNGFTLVNIAFLRGGTELFMMLMRVAYCYKFRNEFN